MKYVIKLFEERKIHTKREALKTITMLASRGKQSNIKALQRLEHHQENALASESHKAVRFNYKRPAKQKYFINGSVITTSKYSKIRSGT